jgi:hypothetical protein
MRIRLMIVAVAPAMGAAALFLGGCEAVLGLGSLTDAQPDGSTGSSSTSTTSSSGTSTGTSSTSGSSTSGGSTSLDGGQTTGLDAHVPDGGTHADATTDGAVTDGPVSDVSTVDSPTVTSCPTACPVKTGLNNPWAVTSDSNRVYWTEFGTDQGTLDGVVASCPVSGCDAGEIVYTSTALNPRGIAVDGTNVYWAGASYGPSNGGIFTCPITGCSGSPKRLATAGIPDGVQVDNSYVYWVDSDSNTVSKISKTSTDGGTFVIYDAGSYAITEPQDCVIDGTYLWIGDLNGIAYRVPVSGGEPVPYNQFVHGGQFGLAVDSTNVYFAEPGEIDSNPKTVTDAGVAIATDVYWTQGLARDPATSFLYWANSGSGTSNVNDGTVGRLLIDGGSEQVLASSQAEPRSITVSGNSVYWVNMGNYVNSSTYPYTGNTPSTGSLYRVDK